MEAGRVEVGQADVPLLHHEGELGTAEDDAFGAAFDNVINFLRGTPTNIVNPGALQVRR